MNNKGRVFLHRVAALFFLLVMVTLLVGRSVHAYSHLPHLHISCSHSGAESAPEQSEGHHDTENCSICNFHISAIANNVIALLSFSVFLMAVLTAVVLSEGFIQVNKSKSRAPPVAIS